MIYSKIVMFRKISKQINIACIHMLLRRDNKTQTTPGLLYLLKLNNAAQKPMVFIFPNLAPGSLNSTVSTSYSSMNILLLVFHSKSLEKNMIHMFVIRGPPPLVKDKGKYDNAQTDNKTNFRADKLPLYAFTRVPIVISSSYNWTSAAVYMQWLERSEFGDL